MKDLAEQKRRIIQHLMNSPPGQRAMDVVASLGWDYSGAVLEMIVNRELTMLGDRTLRVHPRMLSRP